MRVIHQEIDRTAMLATGVASVGIMPRRDLETSQMLVVVKGTKASPVLTIALQLDEVADDVNDGRRRLYSFNRSFFDHGLNG